MEISLIKELIINLSDKYTVDELEFFREKGFINEWEYNDHIPLKRSPFTRNTIPLPSKVRSILKRAPILSKEVIEKMLEWERQSGSLLEYRPRVISDPPLWSLKETYSDPDNNSPKIASPLIYEGPELPGLWDPVPEKDQKTE